MHRDKSHGRTFRKTTTVEIVEIRRLEKAFHTLG